MKKFAGSCIFTMLSITIPAQISLIGCTQKSEPYEAIDDSVPGWIVSDGVVAMTSLWHPREFGVRMGSGHATISKLMRQGVFPLRIVAEMDKDVTITAVLEGVGIADYAETDTDTMSTETDTDTMSIADPEITVDDAICTACYDADELLWQERYPLSFSKEGVAELKIHSQIYGTKEYWLSLVKAGKGEIVLERINY